MKKLVIILIILLAVFLHFYKLTDLTIYNAEIAQNYLAVKNLLNDPLDMTGPNTSHDWLKLSSFSYYLFFPIMLIGRFHPLTGAYAWAIMSILTVLLNYFVIKKIFNEKVALISSLLLTISPGFLIMSRLPHFYNYVIPLTYLMLYFLWRAVTGKSKSLWPIFLLIGIMTTLHASSIILLPIVMTILFCNSGIPTQRDIRNLYKFIPSLLAFLIPNIPFFLADYQKHFLMTKSLILWFPYKIINFFQGQTLDVNKTPAPDKTIPLILDFLKTNIFPPDFPVWWGMIILLIIILLPLIDKKMRSNQGYRITLIWLMIGLFALIIHKNPPLHYFVPIFILPIIIISYSLTVILSGAKNLLIEPIRYFIIAIIFIINIFSQKYFYQQNKVNLPYIPYSIQEKVAKEIIKDAKGKNFTLSRLGPFDFYENQFKDNYQYLLWYLDNEPVDNAKLRYIIVEESSRLPKNLRAVKLKEIEGITILRMK